MTVAVATAALRGAEESSFRLTATSADFSHYFPTYLANGYFSTASSPQGTAPALSLVMGLMDRTPGDVSRPAAVARWAEVDYSNGVTWLNEDPITPAAFTDYSQTLDMYDGTLTTRYAWVNGRKVTDVEVLTFVNQADPHLAVTRLTLTPHFSGPVRLRFPLRAAAPPAQRLALAKLSWRELTAELLQGPATRPLSLTSARPAPPTEILTWFDLQQALAAEGRELNLPGSTAPTRAAIWYAGDVEIESVEANREERVLGLAGRAIAGSEFSQAAAIEFPAGFTPTESILEQDKHGATLEIAAEVEPGRSYTFTKFISLSRHDAHEDIAADLARAKAARANGFDKLFAAHRTAWNQLWESDIIVDGDAELQRLIHADLFYLLQNSSADTSWPMAACGMSPHYFGHVFWDSDNWDFPVLLLLHPERAKSLVSFRARTLAWAKTNAARHGLKGAMYAWESDPENGSEQTPQFAGVNGEREIHLNGDIASAQWQYYLATVDSDWLRREGFPVIRATADFWLSRVTHDTEHDRYEIQHVTSVDEKYTDVNNEAFTNAVAQKNLLIAMEAAKILGEQPDARWAEVANKLRIPFSEREQRHLMFDENVPHDRKTWMGGGITFLTYPSLDLPMSDAVRRNDYQYALKKIAELSSEPNQMMLVMLSIHAAELGDANDALHWLRYDRGLFLKPPFLVRSETSRNNCTYLLASAAGNLQSFLFGFTGLRLTTDGLVPKYHAVLPKDFRRIALKGVSVRNERFDFELTRDATGQARTMRRPVNRNSTTAP